MTITRRLVFTLTFIVAAGSAASWLYHDGPHYLSGKTAGFVAQFAPPPAADSADTRRELDELLAIQSVRSDAQVAASRADRETDVARFYAALGFGAQTDPELPLLRRVMHRAEDDVRIYVRAPKEHFRRLRPYEIESRLEPCIDNVRADLSYPSGHAAYGYSMVYLLARMVPERREQLLKRGDEFAHQRMVCGVHFRSDLEAGRRAAGWLTEKLLADERYRKESTEAARELRAALGLPPTG